MAKILLSIVLLSGMICLKSYAQKKYGYAVLYLRCGKEDPKKDRVYFSPVIELNNLNFQKYTDGMDPAFSEYSVQYYNYAIAKWFEIFLKEQYKIAVNDSEKYERNATTMVFDSLNKPDCNGDKTHPSCFFTDKQKLIIQRNNAISDIKLSKHENSICDVIAL